jgi:hypothetical protein
MNLESDSEWKTNRLRWQGNKSPAFLVKLNPNRLTATRNRSLLRAAHVLGWDSAVRRRGAERAANRKHGVARWLLDRDDR